MRGRQGRALEEEGRRRRKKSQRHAIMDIKDELDSSHSSSMNDVAPASKRCRSRDATYRRAMANDELFCRPSFIRYFFITTSRPPPPGAHSALNDSILKKTGKNWDRTRPPRRAPRQQRAIDYYIFYLDLVVYNTLPLSYSSSSSSSTSTCKHATRRASKRLANGMIP